MNPDLSVIIPVLNEVTCLPLLLNDLQKQKQIVIEIIVADGGSTDGTLEACSSFQPIVVPATRGRACQLNAGFRKSTSENLLFLHADTRIEDEYLLHYALRFWQTKLAKNGNDRIAGHFPLKFIHTSPHYCRSFRYAENKTHFNRVNTTNGDQGFLLKRPFFESLGGFDESQHFLEDQKLAEKIRRHGRWITLPGRLCTSGRRFEKEGFHRRYILMGMIMAMHSTGQKAFFKYATSIYTSHSDSGHLRLKPFFMAGFKMFVNDLGLKESIRAWFFIGRYIRQNSWQMFYFFDILFKTEKTKGSYPFLDLHDRYFWPLTNNTLCDAFNTLISFFWYAMVLAPYFFIVDTVWPHGLVHKSNGTRP